MIKARKNSSSRFKTLLGLTAATTLLLSSVVHAHASFCHLALLKSPKNIKPEMIHATIHELAQLKMTADLAKAAGASQSVVFSARQFGARYQQKLAEMTQNLIGRYSEAQIKEMILKDIQEMQGLRVEELKQETQVREAHKNIEVFTKDHEVGMFDFKNTTYIEAADVLIGKWEKDLVLAIPSDEYKVVIPQRDNRAYSVSPDGHTLNMIDTSGRVQIYDLFQRKTISLSSDGVIKGTDRSTIMSPHGIVITSSGNGHSLDILNLDGTNRNMAPSFVGPGTISKFKFISDHELLILRNGEKSIYVMDLDTGLTQHIETPELYQAAQITPEGDKLLLTAPDSYTVIAVKDLKSLAQKSTHFPKDFTVEGFLGHDLVYVTKTIFIDMEPQVEHAIVKLQDMATPQFGFSDSRPADEIENIIADPKHDRTFIVSFDSNSAEYHLEIWKHEKIH